MAVAVEPAAGVLAAVGAALDRRPEPPSLLVWSMLPDGGEARIWLEVSEPAAGLDELEDALRQVPGVRGVQRQAGGDGKYGPTGQACELRRDEENDAHELPPARFTD